MACKPVICLFIVLLALASLSACGRRGSLEPPADHPRHYPQQYPQSYQ